MDFFCIDKAFSKRGFKALVNLSPEYSEYKDCESKKRQNSGDKNFEFQRPLENPEKI